MSSKRRSYDWYPTPGYATRRLVDHATIDGTVLEPCVGAGDISNMLQQYSLANKIIRNDVDPMREAEFHMDARLPETWAAFPPCDWVVTNPPFSVASEIVPLAYDHAGIGMALLLRLSYLEPCKGRGAWLAAYPPLSLFVLPRISFTGDGRHDSVTCAWMVWDKRFPSGSGSVKVLQPGGDVVSDVG